MEPQRYPEEKYWADLYFILMVPPGQQLTASEALGNIFLIQTKGPKLSGHSDPGICIS